MNINNNLHNNLINENEQQSLVNAITKDEEFLREDEILNGFFSSAFINVADIPSPLFPEIHHEEDLNLKQLNVTSILSNTENDSEQIEVLIEGVLPQYLSQNKSEQELKAFKFINENPVDRIKKLRPIAKQKRKPLPPARLQSLFQDLSNVIETSPEASADEIKQTLAIRWNMQRGSVKDKITALFKQSAVNPEMIPVMRAFAERDMPETRKRYYKNHSHLFNVIQNPL